MIQKYLVALLLCLSGSPAVGNEGSSSTPAPLLVSHPLLASILHEAFGAPTQSLLTGNVDPHHFEPKPSHLKALSEARWVLVLHRRDEAWILKAKGPRTQLVDLSSSQFSHHPWLDPEELPRLILKVHQELPAGFLPAKTQREATIKSWTEKWQDWFKNQRSTLPATSKLFFVKDRALIPFGSSLGVPLRALSSRSHAEEFTLSELKSAKSLIASNRSACYLLSQGENPRTTKALGIPPCSPHPLQLDAAEGMDLWTFLRGNVDLIRNVLTSSHEVSK